MEFNGKSVIITGASSGIGKELAVVLARRGAHLALAARDEGALAETARACEAAGGRAIVVQTDVTDEQACVRLVAETVAAFGGVDVLVNNAGISMWGRFDELTDISIVERIMRVNYFGSVYATYHALPELKKRKGLIVAISSLTGLTGVPTRSAYAASKHAMQGFFDSLRIELGESGVDVLVVSPGYVATPIRSRALAPDGTVHGASPRDESTDTMPVEECVRQIVAAMASRRRDLVMTARARLAMWVKLVAPGVVDRIAAKAVRERGT
ncbi:MAG TPA: SDR family oxidoreductase [Blastocatellia bacterium]|nr:SDR family oxidoreductase [Blastocatellia bacterium]